MPEQVAERLLQAMNDHDAAAMAALFDPGYRSEQPVHPARGFVGSAQVLANWTAVFEGVPDLRADLLRSADGQGWTWTEWRWSGTHTDGSPFAMAGVILLDVVDGRIRAARLYMDPVEPVGGDIEASVRALYRPPAG
jgi:ketosteroid isomerase-like protein